MTNLVPVPVAAVEGTRHHMTRWFMKMAETGGSGADENFGEEESG